MIHSSFLALFLLQHRRFLRFPAPNITFSSHPPSSSPLVRYNVILKHVTFFRWWWIHRSSVYSSCSSWLLFLLSSQQWVLKRRRGMCTLETDVSGHFNISSLPSSKTRRGSPPYVFFKTFTQIFNKLDIQLYMYSRSVSLVTHSLIHILNQAITGHSRNARTTGDRV